MWFLVSLIAVGIGAAQSQFAAGGWLEEDVLFSAAAETPVVTWQPSVADLASFGAPVITTSVQHDAVNKPNQYKCSPPPPPDTHREFEKRWVNSIYAISKCDCQSDGNNLCKGAWSKSYGEGDDRCEHSGGVGVDMECSPVIIDISANTQGHGTYGDAVYVPGDWQASRRPRAQPLYGEAGQSTWEDRAIHPYRIQCPAGYKMIHCSINSPRQHARQCPIRPRDLMVHTKSGVTPADPEIARDFPLMYADYANNICQTTSVMNAFDTRANNYRLDPWAGKSVQARCVMDV